MKQNRTVTVIDDVNEYVTRKVFGIYYNQTLQQVYGHIENKGVLLFLTKYDDYTNTEFDNIKQEILKQFPDHDIIIYRENPDGLPF